MRLRSQTLTASSLPRQLRNGSLAVGAESRDFFGFAQGKEDGRYVGFTFGRRTSLFLDSSLLLIEPVTAAGYAEAQRAAEEAAKAMKLSRWTDVDQ